MLGRWGCGCAGTHAALCVKHRCSEEWGTLSGARTADAPRASMPACLICVGFVGSSSSSSRRPSDAPESQRAHLLHQRLWDVELKQGVQQVGAHLRVSAGMLVQELVEGTCRGLELGLHMSLELDVRAGWPRAGAVWHRSVRLPSA